MEKEHKCQGKCKSHEAPEEINFLEQLQRLQAEFDNYRKRVENEKIMLSDNAKSNVLAKFLDVKENFDRAPKLDEGMELIYKQFQKIFTEENIKEVENEQFDFKVHEAIATDPNVKKNQIVDVVQKGYFRGKNLIRPSKVVVGVKENE
ncbi:MAG: nucleotide exchange factor GrpE [Nanoarchaeota archaeon]|nr:nucleotide exchange factor GrpE [Nanoarchaeota archaeon]